MGDRDTRRRADLLFGTFVVVSLAVRAILAALLPLLGDEAYFVTWGMEPALGYYDHPPLVGWVLAALLTLGSQTWILRLPTLIAVTVVGLALYLLARHERPLAGALAGGLFLLTPVHLVGVMVLTDTPLVLFGALSGCLFVLAVRRGDSPVLYGLAGLALGLAWLSKYLAALYVLGFLVAALSGERRRRRLVGLGIVLAVASPFVLFNLWWNLEHCWANVLFNLVNRHVGEAPRRSGVNSVSYWIATHLFVATPPVLFFVVRRRDAIRRILRTPWLRTAVILFAVPIGVLLVGAAGGFFGAYWVLPFYPFFFLGLAFVLDRRQLAVGLVLAAAVGVVLAGFLGWAVTRPVERWARTGSYDSLVTMLAHEEVTTRIRDVRNGERLAARAYSPASLLAWSTGEHVVVFGEGSHYARHDDAVSDFRALDGEDFLIFQKNTANPEQVESYFERVEVIPIPVRGAELFVVRGIGFRYRHYRDEVLARIRNRYYDAPQWLPTIGCPFCERYWGDEGCRKKRSQRSVRARQAGSIWRP